MNSAIFTHLGSTFRIAFVRCILASGVSLEESLVIRSILEDDDQEQEGAPLVVSTPEIADKRVGDVLTDAPMISLLQVGCSHSVAAPAVPCPWNSRIAACGRVGWVLVLVDAMRTFQKVTNEHSVIVRPGLWSSL